MKKLRREEGKIVRLKINQNIYKIRINKKLTVKDKLKKKKHLKYKQLDS
jgi:hypothetical protein